MFVHLCDLAVTGFSDHPVYLVEGGAVRRATAAPGYSTQLLIGIQFYGSCHTFRTPYVTVLSPSLALTPFGGTHASYLQP